MRGPVAVAYLGPEWGKRALRVIRSDPRVQQAVRSLELTVLTVIDDPPKGRYGYFYAAFAGKGLAAGEVGHMDDGKLAALAPPDFTIRGPYEVFAAIQRGEITERIAVLSGRLHVEGSRIAALRHMGALETVTAALAEIPCRT